MKQTTDFFRMALAVAAMLALTAASGCGQKGPLYLPGNPSEMQTIDPGISGVMDEDDDDADAAGSARPPGAGSDEQA